MGAYLDQRESTCSFSGAGHAQGNAAAPSTCCLVGQRPSRLLIAMSVGGPEAVHDTRYEAQPSLSCTGGWNFE